MLRVRSALFCAAAAIAAVCAASVVGFAQQQQNPSSKQMMMDCERMMQRQGQGVNDQMKAMMERCASMMGQAPSGDSTTAPGTQSPPKKE
jgi:hypothetical protein